MWPEILEFNQEKGGSTMENRTCLNCKHMRICYLFQQLINGQDKTGGILRDFRIVLKVVGEQCESFKELGEEE